MPKKDYAFEWYKYGHSLSDPIMRFMTYWIAFNWLYNGCSGGSERARIRRFCNENYTSLSHFDAFSTDAIAVFEEGEVTDAMERNDGMREFEGLFDNSEKTRIKSLLVTIYQVRCNLFHGSKRLYLERDQTLIESSAAIMEGYLTAYFQESNM